MVPRILLISANQCTFPYPVFPLGIAHVASALTARGFITDLFDMQVDTGRLHEVIESFRPDYIGVSFRNIDDIQINNTSFYAPLLKEVTEEIRKKSDVPVILGGSGFSLFPQELLELTGADFGIWGEGEESFPDLLECLSSKSGYESIPGLVFRQNGDIVVNSRKSCSLGAVAPLQRPKGLVDYYLKKSSMLNIQTQRGCAYRCCYCTYPVIEGRNVRYRSPESVCDEIAGAVACGAGYMFIVDSVFNTSPTHVTAICEEMIRRNIKINWGCYMRPKAVTQPLIDTMVQAGLTHIEFGTDSLCDSILESYGKDFTVKDVLEASECARKAGVHYAHFLISGGPGETEETIGEGFNNSGYIKKTVFFSYIGMRLYPNTPLYEFALKEGAVSKENDLLSPYFYVTPHVSKERISEMLTEFNNLKKNWVIGESTPELVKIIGDLRSIGVAGPLWEFLAR